MRTGGETSHERPADDSGDQSRRSSDDLDCQRGNHGELLTPVKAARAIFIRYLSRGGRNATWFRNLFLAAVMDRLAR